jgi:ATP adenylyltransferase
LHLIPRSSPVFPLGEGHGNLDLNALGYAGLLLVRSQDEDRRLDEVIATLPNGIVDILASCAIDRKYGEEALQAEATYHGGAGSLDVL